MSSQLVNESEVALALSPKRRGVWRVYRLLRPAVLSGSLMLLLAYSAVELVGGGPSAVAAEKQGDTPAVVELFTSLSCYSCPPAEKLLGELIENSDKQHLVALEFHVDYWDKLVYRSHGSHKDPFSSQDNSLRQRSYNNEDIRGQRGVFTPQMIVNGRYGAVGSKRRTVNDSLHLVERPAVVISVSERGDAGGEEAQLRVALQGDLSAVPDTAQVWLAVFDIEETTAIPSGENHGKTLTNHHVVRSFDAVSPRGGLSALQGSDGDWQLDVNVTLGEGQGCALLLQDIRPGPVHGASYCPEAVWKPKSS